MTSRTLNPIPLPKLELFGLCTGESIEGPDMRVRQVRDMDIVPNADVVRRFVVISKNSDRPPKALPRFPKRSGQDGFPDHDLRQSRRLGRRRRR
jgi:hypothetical protein